MAIVLNGACRLMELRDGAPQRHGPLRVWRHVGRDSGAEAISLRVLELDAGTTGLVAGACEEVLFVIQGRGTAYLDGWPHEIEPDVGLFVAPRARLTLVNAEPQPLALVSSQCPDPGPGLELTEPLTRPMAGAC